MSPRPSPSSESVNRQTYVPAAAQQAMSQQMQRSLPAHLKQYVGSDRPTYVPQRVQEQITAHLQKSSSAHLQQYAGAFVQQNIVDPSLRGGVASRPVKAAAPIPDRLNQSHRGDTGGEQHDAQFLNLFQPDKPGQPSQEVAGPPQEGLPASPGPSSSYDFIMNPQKPPRQSFLSGGSMVTRMAVLGGGLVLLLILFIVASSLLKSGGIQTAPFVAVAQDQTELTRVAQLGITNGSSQQVQNLAYGVKLSQLSATQQLVTYLTTNGKKLDAKELALKHSSSTDSQLSSAKSDGTFDSEFISIIQNDLAVYSRDLKAAYNTKPGPKGQALLSGQYKGAQLLLTQSKQQ